MSSDLHAQKREFLNSTCRLRAVGAALDKLREFALQNLLVPTLLGAFLLAPGRLQGNLRTRCIGSVHADTLSQFAPMHVQEQN